MFELFFICLILINFLVNIFIFNEILIEKKIKKQNYVDEITKIHVAINECLETIVYETNCNSAKLFQAINGDYYVGGTPLIKFILSNERTDSTTKRIKGKLKPVNATKFLDALILLKKEKIITLSEQNQYECLEESKEKLIQRGMKSGIYIQLTNHNDRTIGILCIEYKTDKPTYTQEEISRFCFEEIYKIKQLINQKFKFL